MDYCHAHTYPQAKCYSCTSCHACWGSCEPEIFKYKAPKTQHNYIGVELEFISPLAESQVATKFEEAGLDSYVTLKDDGSVDGDGHGHEIAVLCPEKQYRQIMKKVCAVLKEAKATVNATCGMHVHIDMRNRSRTRVFKNLVRSQDLLFAMQPPSRHHNGYCRRTAGLSFETARRSGHRGAINASAYSKHKTIEVRLHAGTVNFRKITNWIATLLAIANKPNIVRNNISTVNQFAVSFRVSPKLKRYIGERVTLFQSEMVREDLQQASGHDNS